jgi:hypothetical protein
MPGPYAVLPKNWFSEYEIQRNLKEAEVEVPIRPGVITRSSKQNKDALREKKAREVVQESMSETASGEMISKTQVTNESNVSQGHDQIQNDLEVNLSATENDTMEILSLPTILPVGNPNINPNASYRVQTRSSIRNHTDAKLQSLKVKIIDYNDDKEINILNDMDKIWQLKLSPRHMKHTKSKSIGIAPSLLQSAGYGVFSIKYLPEEIILCQYGTKKVDQTTDWASKFNSVWFDTVRGLQITSHPAKHYGGWFNDPLNELAVNAEIRYDSHCDKYVVCTLTPLIPGQEIYIHYGIDYWNTFLRKETNISNKTKAAYYQRIFGFKGWKEIWIQ